MKRRIIITIILIAAAAIAIACSSLPAPSFQTDIASAADLGLLLLDTNEGISVLGVQDKSIAEQVGIHPEDVLLHINGISLSTVEALDNLLINCSEDTLSFKLQRGKNEVSVQITLPSIVY